MAKLLALFAVLIFSTLSFGQAADRPATGDRRDPNTPTATGTDEARNNHDWGWIGLIGLAGLGGLAGRRKREEMGNREREGTRLRPVA